ncbi:MAG: hypothetical protein FJ279_15795 [Planctomycetes bacterium]|nr:hypothetical protein [Planctomycetota bacterium]
MMLQIKRWMSPPAFPDDEIKTSRAHLLNSALINVLTLVPVLVIGNLLEPRSRCSAPICWRWASA